MIQFYIGSTQECGVVLKLERFSHLSGRSFGLGSPIGLDALSDSLCRKLVGGTNHGAA